MRILSLIAAGTALGLAGLMAASPAGADEGMWTFDDFPAARMRSAHGWAPDQMWLDRVRGAAVRLLLCAELERVKGDALHHLQAAQACGVAPTVYSGDAGAATASSDDRRENR